jgi:hypothetical protein
MPGLASPRLSNVRTTKDARRVLAMNDMRLTPPQIVGCFALFLDQRVQLDLCRTGIESFCPLKDAYS